MYKVFLLLFVLIIAYSRVNAQGVGIQAPYFDVNPCEPCASPPMDVTNFTQSGWPVETSSVQINYGGCSYLILYKKRKCTGYDDLKIEGIVPMSNCKKKLTDRGGKTNCEWLKEMQNMATFIMSQLLRSNAMGFTTNNWWRILTPACFELTNLGFRSPTALPPLGSSGCSKHCCLRYILVMPDSCGDVKMREVRAFSDGGCPMPPNAQGNKPSLEKDCDFTGFSGGMTCIPICDRKLTEVENGLEPFIPAWLR